MLKQILSMSTRDIIIYTFGIIALLAGLGSLIYAVIFELRLRQSKSQPQPSAEQSARTMRLRSAQAPVQPVTVKVSAVVYGNVKPVLDALCYLYAAYNKFVDKVNEKKITYKADQGVISLFRDTVTEALSYVILSISKDNIYQESVSKQFNDAFVELRNKLFGANTNLATWLKSDGALGFDDTKITISENADSFTVSDESVLPLIHVTRSTSDEPVNRVLLFNSNMSKYTNTRDTILKKVTDAFLRIGTITTDGVVNSSLQPTLLLPDNVNKLLQDTSFTWIDEVLFNRDGTGFAECAPSAQPSQAFRPIQLIQVPELSEIQQQQQQQQKQQQVQHMNKPIQHSRQQQASRYTPFI
jgi:hypothetical protein